MPRDPATLARYEPVFAALLALAGFLLVFYASSVGIGVSPDSAQYMMAARDLHTPADLLRFPSHWAPGYPLLLAFADVFVADIRTAARLVQGLLLAALVYAATRLARDLLPPGARLWTLVPGVLLLTSMQVYDIHYFAWSEAPFVLALLLSAWALVRYLETPTRGLLFAAAMLAALCVLMRYAGFAWAATGALVLLLHCPGPLARRFLQGLAFGALSLLPLALWLGVNALARGETTNRTLAVHLVGVSDFRALLGEWLGWFGGRLWLPLGVVLVMLSGIALWFALRDTRRSRLHCFALVTGWFALGYTGFILFSKSFLDAYIPLDGRIFSPLYVVVFVLLGTAVAMLGMRSQPWTLALAGVVTVGLVAANLRLLMPLAAMDHLAGRGYLSRMLAVTSNIDELPFLEGARLYSNAADYVGLVSRFSARDYPRKYDPTTERDNATYEDEMRAMSDAVRAGNAYVVHYPGFEGRVYFPDAKDIGQLGLQLLITGNGVFVLGAPATTADAGTRASDE